jgi:hypothetical protein
MQKFVMILASVLFVFVAGVFTGKHYFGKADKTTTTEVVSETSKASSTDTTVAVTTDKKTNSKSHVAIKRETKKPDGTIVSEDIVGEFWVETIEQENIVMKQKTEVLEKENMLLRQKIEEDTLPEWQVTLMPGYEISKPFKLESLDYTLMIEKRIFWTCYAGIAIKKDWVGVPLTCGLK